MLFDFKDSRFWRYYPYIFLNKRRFEKMLDTIESFDDPDQKYQLAKDAATFAYLHSTGYLCSERLENIFLDIAQVLPPVTCHPQKGTVLHVLSQAVKSGGHTRVVQRWIELSKSDEQHSVVLLKQGNEDVPTWLKDATKAHNGEVYQYEEDTDLHIAFRLREQAAQYEKIILHIYINDPIAILAFGTDTFTTPVILFNHADHLFWLGVSISDMVADFRAQNITHKRCVEHKLLGLPPAEKKELPDYQATKATIRRELKIPEDAFVLVSVGTKYKFNPVGGYSFAQIISEVLTQIPNAYCYVIGPDGAEPFWQKSKQATSDRIVTLGEIYNKDLYYKYLKASDLYVGSFPMESDTAMLDGVQCGIPFIQLTLSAQKNFNFGVNLTEIEPNRCYTSHIKEYISRIIACATDANKYELQWQDSKQIMNMLSDPEVWKNALQNIYASTPVVHHVHSFKPRQGKEIAIDDRAVVATAILNRKWEIKSGLYVGLSMLKEKIVASFK